MAIAQIPPHFAKVVYHKIALPYIEIFRLIRFVFVSGVRGFGGNACAC
jgi:hypothetical protein